MHILKLIKSTSYNYRVDIEVGTSVAVVMMAFIGALCVRNTR